MPLPRLASVLGHSSLRHQKYVHPTQDHQQAEMDRIDKIRQESKRRYADLMLPGPQRAHDSRESEGFSGHGGEWAGNGAIRIDGRIALIYQSITSIKWR